MGTLCEPEEFRHLSEWSIQGQHQALVSNGYPAKTGQGLGASWNMAKAVRKTARRASSQSSSSSSSTAWVTVWTRSTTEHHSEQGR